jgi:hypothetical protein
MVPIGDLRPNKANPNKHPAGQLALYAAAIRAHGWRESVTVSKLSGLVVRGHGALLAARLVGAASVPVEFQGYATPEEELADLLADNRLAQLATTDAELLKSALQILSPAAITGYSGLEIAELLAELAPPPEYPITARLNERHDYLVITVDNETDWQFLKNLAGVRTERSFKNTMIGEGRAIPFPRFLKSLRENLHSIPQARGDDHDAPARACRHRLRAGKPGGRLSGRRMSGRPDTPRGNPRAHSETRLDARSPGGRRRHHLPGRRSRIPLPMLYLFE